MKKLLVFCDNYVYGGCDRLMYSIVANSEIRRNYLIVFAYGNNSQMNKGIKQEYSYSLFNDFVKIPLINDVCYSIRVSESSYPKVIKILLKMLLWLLRNLGIKTYWNKLMIIIYLRRISPDIIHVNNGGYPGSEWCRFLAIVAARVNIPFVFQVNNQAVLSKRSEQKTDCLINSKAAAFVVASYLAKSALIENRGFDANKILVIPNTIRDENITLSREQVLKEFNIPVNSYVIVEVAFYEKRKGQTYLLDALYKLLKRNQFDRPVHLILVGSGIEEENLKKRVGELQLEVFVTFTGYRKDSINFINACDLFVLPSIANEDMPLVVLSAMKLGKNIIASRFAGIEYEIADKTSGLLVDPNPNSLSEELEQEIRKVIENKCQFGLNAKQRFEEIFSNDRYTKSILDLYKKVI